MTSVQIFVRGLDGRHIALVVGSNESIDDLKLRIQKKLGLPPKDQFLHFAGKRREKGTIYDYGLQQDCTIVLTLGLKAGVCSIS
jgi:hypothetical protein